MRVKTLLIVVCWAFAGMLMVPMMSTSSASAARLAVTAGPIQTWRVVNGMPEPALPPALVALTPGHEAVTATEPQTTGSQPSGHQDPDHPVIEEEFPDAPESVDPHAPAPASAPEHSPGQADPSEPPVAAPQTPDVDLSDCGDLAAYDEVVYGTPGDDHLVAGAGRQVLVGLGGDDTLSGGQGGDCLVGGAGDDELDTGDDAGDTCVATEADDEIVMCDDDGPPADGPEVQPTDPAPSPESQQSAGGAEAETADPGQPVG